MRRALEEAAAALPAHAARIAEFGERFRWLASIGDETEAAIAAGDAQLARAVLADRHRPTAAALRAEMRGLIVGLEAEMQAASSALTAGARASAGRTLAITAGAGALAILVASLLLRHGFAHPLAALSARMRALAAGDSASPVPGLDRRDEFRAMAAALEGFRLAEIERERLRRVADTDALTGVLNRRGGIEAVEAAAAHGPLAAIAIDLDHFKRANDEHGHEAGDAVLREAARRIRECVRGHDLVCRPGGDEFLVALPGMQDVETLYGVALRLREALHLPVLWEGKSLRLGATLGIAIGPAPGGAHALLRRADEALMRAKRGGARGTVLMADAAA